MTVGGSTNPDPGNLGPNPDDDVVVTGELVPISDVVTKMRDSGMSPDTISTIIGIPAIQIRTLLLQARPISPEEQDIADATRRLIKRGIIYANQVLDVGTRQEKMAVLKSTLALAGRTLAKTDEADLGEGRAILEGLFSQMRVGTVRELVDIPNPEDI